MLFSRHSVAVTLLNSFAQDWVFKPSIMATGGLTRSHPSPKTLSYKWLLGEGRGTLESHVLQLSIAVYPKPEMLGACKMAQKVKSPTVKPDGLS